MKKNFPRLVLDERIWKGCPALLVALSWLFGLSVPLLSGGNVLWALVWACYLIWIKKPLQLVFVLGAGLFGTFFVAPKLEIKEIPFREARFSLASIEPHHTPFSKGFLYKGTLDLPEGRFSCSLFSKDLKSFSEYKLDGKLVQRQKGLFFCKGKQKSSNLKKSLPFFRYQLKQKVRAWMEEKSGSVEVARFLSGLVTGSLDDRELRFACARLGVGHVLAVSGLHFGTILGCASFFLSFFLGKRWIWGTLMALATLFFLLIGPNAAVERSWWAALLYLVGRLLKREVEPLNFLGIALFVELVWDPLRLLNVGMQLSFLSVAAILLIYPKIASFFLPEKKTVITCVQKVLGKSLALTLSVSVVLLPVLLFHFHFFPLLSLVYNLFIPLSIATLLSILFFSLPLILLFSPIGNLLLFLTFQGAQGLLWVLHHPPMPLDFVIGVQALPGWVIPLWLLPLFLIALSLKKGCHWNEKMS